MKNSIAKISLFTLLTSACFISCQSPAENLIQANEKAQDANDDLKEANEEYANEIAAYKAEMLLKTQANEKSIADFKERIKEQKNDAKADYAKKIEALEKKNTDMKKQIEDYKASGKSNWDNFKTEFNHDMDEMGKAMKALFNDDVK